MPPSRSRPDDQQALARFVFPLLDLTARTDRQLARTRTRRIVAIGGWVLLFVVGVVGALNLGGHPLLQLGAFAAIVAGVLNTGFSIGGLVRVVGEQQARAAQVRAFLAHPETSRWGD